MTCSVCNQEIHREETGDTIGESLRHIYFADCVAATRLATARRCAEIAKKIRVDYKTQWDQGGSGYAFCYDRSVAAREVGETIEAEFGIKEPKV